MRLKEAMRAYAERTGEKVSYNELATKTGLSRATIEAIGSRESYNPTLSTVDKLCEALDCSVGDLLEHVVRSP